MSNENCRQDAPLTSPCPTSRVAVDRPWDEYPIGTKAHAYNGGHWVRVVGGWKWCTGSTFPTPGADAIGNCIELPG